MHSEFLPAAHFLIAIDLIALYIGLGTSTALPAQPNAPGLNTGRAAPILASLLLALWLTVELLPHAGPAGWLAAVKTLSLLMSLITTLSVASSGTCAPSLVWLSLLEWLLVIACAAYIAANALSIAALELVPADDAPRDAAAQPLRTELLQKAELDVAGTVIPGRRILL